MLFETNDLFPISLILNSINMLLHYYMWYVLYEKCTQIITETFSWKCGEIYIKT